ncbi:Uncharacterized protein PCOAH_00008020 [Plasmodium coatneyi]|uniref:Uncharacterized protein n=1 Tax=Plasmodium coatneyi TaxID=208452 RepID=A0A1B1DUT3_9APIC|nr:Uncharacterized protein PCOAH_00008020 [Plasmodium coatneyi]ANQ06409.1 Uncharacterized protein PCOAH_00008020 [Plasmodium coatneyi]
MSSVQGSSVNKVLCRNKMKVTFDHGLTYGGVYKGTAKMEKNQNAEWYLQNYAYHVPVKKGPYLDENAKVYLLVMRHLHRKHDNQNAIYGEMKRNNFLNNIKCGVLLLLVLYKNRKKASLVADLAVNSGSPESVMSHGEETYDGGDACRDDETEQESERGRNGNDEKGIYLDAHSRGRTTSQPPPKNILFLKTSGDNAILPFCNNINYVKVKKKIGYHKRNLAKTHLVMCRSISSTSVNHTKTSNKTTVRLLCRPCNLRCAEDANQGNKRTVGSFAPINDSQYCKKNGKKVLCSHMGSNEKSVAGANTNDLVTLLRSQLFHAKGKDPQITPKSKVLIFTTKDYQNVPFIFPSSSIGNVGGNKKIFVAVENSKISSICGKANWSSCKSRLGGTPLLCSHVINRFAANSVPIMGVIAEGTLCDFMNFLLQVAIPSVVRMAAAMCVIVGSVVIALREVLIYAQLCAHLMTHLLTKRPPLMIRHRKCSEGTNPEQRYMSTHKYNILNISLKDCKTGQVIPSHSKSALISHSSSILSKKEIGICKVGCSSMESSPSGNLKAEENKSLLAVHVKGERNGRKNITLVDMPRERVKQPVCTFFLLCNVSNVSFERDHCLMFSTCIPIVHVGGRSEDRPSGHTDLPFCPLMNSSITRRRVRFYKRGMSPIFCITSDEYKISEKESPQTILPIVGNPRLCGDHPWKSWKYGFSRRDPAVCSNQVGDSEWGGNSNEYVEGGNRPTGGGNPNEGGNYPQEVNNNPNGNGNGGGNGAGNEGDGDDRDWNDNNEDNRGGFPEEEEEEEENVLMGTQNGKTKKKRKKKLNDKSRNINKATSGRKGRKKMDILNDMQEESNVTAGNYGSVRNVKPFHNIGGMNSVAGVNHMGGMHNGSFAYSSHVPDKIMHDSMGKLNMKSGGGYPSRMGGPMGDHVSSNAVGQMPNGNLNMYLGNHGNMPYVPPYGNSNGPVGISLNSRVGGSINGSLGNNANSSTQASNSMHGQMNHMNSVFRNSIMKSNSSQVNRMMSNTLSPHVPNGGVNSSVNSGVGNNMGNYGMHFNQQKGSVSNGHVGNKVIFQVNGQMGVGYGMNNGGSSSFVHPSNNHVGNVPNSLSSSVSSNANMHMEGSSTSGSTHKKGHVNLHQGGNKMSTSSVSSQLGGLPGTKSGVHMNGHMRSPGSGHMVNQIGARGMTQTGGPLMSQTSGHSNKSLISTISIDKLSNSSKAKSGNGSLNLNNHMMNQMASYVSPNMGRSSVTKSMMSANVPDGMNNAKMKDTVMNNNLYRSNSLLRDTLVGSNKANQSGSMMKNEMVKNQMMKNQMRNNNGYMIGMVNNNLVNMNMQLGARGNFPPMNNLPICSNGSPMKFAGERYAMNKMLPNGNAGGSNVNGGMMIMNREMSEMGNTPGMISYLSGNNTVNKNMRGLKVESSYPFEQMNMRNDQLNQVQVQQANMGNMTNMHMNVNLNSAKMYLNNVQVGSEKLSSGNFLQGESNHPYSYGSGLNGTCGSSVHNQKDDMNEIAGNASVYATGNDVECVSSKKNNTVLNNKKKNKNNLKNGREDELNNSQNLRSVKINWSKYDSIFKKIKLEKDYEKFINTDEEKINISDADTEDKSDWDQNPDPGSNDLLNINFRSFIHDYNDVLNKLNSIKVNDKNGFKKNAYTELYEEIFLNIERFFDISQLRHENNFTHSNFYKNTLDRVTGGDMLFANGNGSDCYEGGITSTEVVVVTPTAASATASSVANKAGMKKPNGGISQCSNAEKENNDDDEIMNKGKTNFFQSVSLSADNNTLFEMLLKKKKEFDEICTLHNFDSAITNEEGPTGNETSGRNFLSSSLLGSPAKNKIGATVADYRSGVTHLASGNVRHTQEGNPGTNKKGGSEVKNAAYQNHFIEKILSKRYRTYSINEFVNVQLNDNLLELIDIYKQNLCFNIRKMLKKRISHQGERRFDWHYGAKRMMRIGKKTQKGRRKELLRGRKKKRRRILRKGDQFPGTTLKLVGKMNNSDKLVSGEAGLADHLGGDDHPVTGAKNASGENLEKPLFSFSSGNVKKKKKIDQEDSANVGDSMPTEGGRKCKQEEGKDDGINNIVSKLSFGLFQTKLKSPQKSEGEMKNKSESTVDHCTMENHGDISLYIEKKITQKKSYPMNGGFTQALKMEWTNLSISRLQKRLFEERQKNKLNKRKKMMNLKYKTNAIIDFGDKIVWVSFEFNHLDTLRKIRNNIFQMYNLRQIEKMNKSEINLEKCITNEMRKYKNVKIRFYKFLSYYDFVFLKNRLNFIKIKYKNGVAKNPKGMTFPGSSLTRLADTQGDHPAEPTAEGVVLKEGGGGTILSDPTVGNVKCEVVEKKDRSDSSPQDGSSKDVDQRKGAALLSDVHPSAEFVTKDNSQTGVTFCEEGLIKGGEVNNGNNPPVLKSEVEDQRPQEQVVSPLHGASVFAKSEHPKSEVIYPYLPFAKGKDADINQLLNDVKNLCIEPNDNMIKKKKLRKDITLFPLIDKKRLNTYIRLDLNAAAKKEELVTNETTNNYSIDKEINILNKFLSTGLKLEKMEFGKVGSGITTTGTGGTVGLASGPTATAGIVAENYDHTRNHHMHSEKHNATNSVLIDNCVWSNNPSLFSIFEKYYLLLKMQKYILQYKHFSKNSIKKKLSSESNCDAYSSSNSLKGSSSGNVRGRRRYGKGSKGAKRGGGRRLPSKGARLGVAGVMTSTNEAIPVDDLVGVKRRRKVGVASNQPCEDLTAPMGDAEMVCENNGMINSERNEQLGGSAFVKVEQEGAQMSVDSIQNEGGDLQGIALQGSGTPIGKATNGSVEVPPEQIGSFYPPMKNELEDDVNVPNGGTFAQDVRMKNELSAIRTCRSGSNSSGSVRSANMRNSIQKGAPKREVNFLEVETDKDVDRDSDGEAEFDTEFEMDDGSGKKRRGRKKGKKRGRKKGGRNKCKLEEDNITEGAENSRTIWRKKNGEYEKYQLKDMKRFADFTNSEEMLDEVDKEILANEIIPIDKDIIIDLLCEEEKLIESYIKNSKFVDKNLICFLIYLNTVQKRLSCISNRLLRKVIRENKMPPKISENVSRSDEITYRYLMFERWNQLRYSLFYNINYVRSGSRVMLHEGTQADGYKNVNIQTIFDLHKFSGKYRKQKLPPFEYSIFLKYKIHRQSKSSTGGDGGESSPSGRCKEGVEETQDEEALFINNEENFCGFSNNTDLNITPVLSYCCVCFNDDYNSTQIGEQGDAAQNVSRNNSISNPSVEVKNEIMDKTQQGQGRSRSTCKREDITPGSSEQNGREKGATEMTTTRDGTLGSVTIAQMKNPPGECEKKINGTSSGTDIAIIEKNIKSNRNLMMRCVRCYMHVHKFCYISTKKTEESSSTYAQATTSIGSNEWLCQRCEFEKKTLGNNYLYLFDNHIKCYICIERGGAFIQLRSDIFVHTFCAMFCVPDLLVNANVNLENLEEFLKLNNLSLTQEVLSSLERKRRKLLMSKNPTKGAKQDGLSYITGNSNLIDPGNESLSHPSLSNLPVNTPPHVNGAEEKTADFLTLGKNEETEGRTNSLSRHTFSGSADRGSPNAEVDTEHRSKIQSIKSIFSKNYISSVKQGVKKNVDTMNAGAKVGEFFPFEKEDKKKRGSESGDDQRESNSRANLPEGGDANRSDFDHSKETDRLQEKKDSVRMQYGESYPQDGYSSSESSCSTMTASSIRSDSTFPNRHGDATLNPSVGRQKEKNLPSKPLSCSPYLLNGYVQDKVRCDVCLKSKGLFIKCENIKCEKYVHPLCAYMCGLYIKCKNSDKKFLKFQNKIDYCFPRIFFFTKCIFHSIKKCGVIRIYDEIIKRRTKYLNRDLYPSIYESNKKERKQKNSVKYKIRNNGSNIKKGGSIPGAVGSGPAAIAAGGGGIGGGTGDVYEVLAFNFNYLDSYQYNFFLLPSIDYIKNDICLVCFTSHKKKKLLYCKYCNMCVHKSCYLIDSTYLEYHFYRKNKRTHTFLMHSKQQKVKNLLGKLKEKKEALLNILLGENSHNACYDLPAGGVVTAGVKREDLSYGQIIPHQGMDLPPRENTRSDHLISVKCENLEEQLPEGHHDPPAINPITIPEGGEPSCVAQGEAAPEMFATPPCGEPPQLVKPTSTNEEIEKSKQFKELMQKEVMNCLYTPEYFQSAENMNKLKEFKKKQKFLHLSENGNYRCEEEKCLTDLDDIEERKLFVCDLCANNYNHENVNCILCSRRGGAIKLIKVNDHNRVDKNKNKKNAFLKGEKDFVFVHMQCALYAPQIVIQDIGEEYYQIFNYDNFSAQECDQVEQMKEKDIKSDTEVCSLNNECDYDEKQSLLGEFLYRHAAAPSVNKGTNIPTVASRKNFASSALPVANATSSAVANVAVSGTATLPNTVSLVSASLNPPQGIATEMGAPVEVDTQMKNETNEGSVFVGEVVPPVSCSVSQPNPIGNPGEGEGNAKEGTDGVGTLSQNAANNVPHNEEQCGANLVKKEQQHTTELHNLMNVAQNGGALNWPIITTSSNVIPNKIDKNGRKLKKGKEILSYGKSSSMLGDTNKRLIVTPPTHVGFSNKKTTNLYYYNFNRRKNNYKIIIKDKLKKHLNKNVCYICNLTYGYTQKCVENNCNHYFHISCAKIHKLFFEFDYTFFKIYPNVTSMQISKLPNCSVGAIIFCEVHSRIRRKINPSIKLFSKLRSFLELARIIVGQMKKREDIKNEWIREKENKDITAIERGEIEEVDIQEYVEDDPEEVDDVENSLFTSDDEDDNDYDDGDDSDDDEDYSEEEEEGSILSGSDRGVRRSELYALQTGGGEGEGNTSLPMHSNQFDDGGTGGDRPSRLPSDAIRMMHDSAPCSSSSSRSGLSRRSNNTKGGEKEPTPMEDQLQMEGIPDQNDTLDDHHKFSVQSDSVDAPNGESNEPLSEEMQNSLEDQVDKTVSDKDEDYVPEDEGEDS